MATKVFRIILSSMVIALAAQVAKATSDDSHGQPLFVRDATYERDLQWEASADKAVTPAKVLRWMMGYHGQMMSAPSSTEFQPIVRSHNGQSQYIAAIAYKF